MTTIPDHAESEPTVGVDASWFDVVAAVVAAAMVVFLLRVGVGVWASRIAVLLGVVPLGWCLLVRLARRGDRPAQLLMAFLAWTLVTAVALPGTRIILLGSAERHSSWLIYSGAAAVWAIGRHATDRAARWIGWGTVAGAVLNGVFAVLQLAFEPKQAVMVLSEGRPPGLATHPVFFGAFATVAGGWFAYRMSRRFSWWDVGGLAVSGLLTGLSGTRVTAAAVVLVAVAAAWVARRPAVLAGPPAVVLGVLIATPVYDLRGAGEGGSDVGASTIDRVSSGGLADRFEVWSYAISGWKQRPLTGWGLGRFGPASQGHLSDAWVRRFGLAWGDAHNVALELLVTTGVVGVVVMVAFVVVQLPRLRGAAVWMVVGLALHVAVEPISAGTLGLAALLLGLAAGPPVDAGPFGERLPAPRTQVLLAAGVVLGAWHLAAYQAFEVPPEPPAGPEFGVVDWWLSGDAVLFERAATLLALGGQPDGSELSAVIDDAANGDGRLIALEWSERAVQIEPDFASWQSALALRRVGVDDLDGARAAAERALELQPNNVLALQVLNIVGYRVGDDELIRLSAEQLCIIDECPPGWAED